MIVNPLKRIFFPNGMVSNGCLLCVYICGHFSGLGLLVLQKKT